jgi:hypothetical protein
MSTLFTDVVRIHVSHCVYMKDDKHQHFERTAPHQATSNSVEVNQGCKIIHPFHDVPPIGHVLCEPLRPLPFHQLGPPWSPPALTGGWTSRGVRLWC